MASSRSGRTPMSLGQASFSSKAARVKTPASSSRPPVRSQSVRVTPANKDTSTAKRTTSTTYKAAPATGARPKLVNDVKEQRKTGQQPGTMTREPEVEFLKHDITELKVNVIVCPAHPELVTTGGIARVVMQKAGSGLKLLFAKKRKEGKLPTGHAFVSGSFDLPHCEHIIHVVVPNWSDNEHPGICIRALECAFFNCFKELRNVQARAPAGRGKVETLAIPALGAGTNKIPKEIVAEIMCDAVKKFLDNRNSLAPHLKKIILVSLDVEMLLLLTKEWTSLARPTRSGDGESGDKVRSEYARRNEPVSARSGASNYTFHNSFSKDSPSTSGSNWYNDFPISKEKGDHTSGRHHQLHSHDALIARGGTSRDKSGQHYQQTGKTDQSKKRDYLWTTNGRKSYHKDDSDSENYAYGRAYDFKSGEGYPLSGKLDQSRKMASLWTTNGRASDNTGSDSENENGASGSGYGCRSGMRHDLPHPKGGCTGVMDSKNVSWFDDITSCENVRHRRPPSSDDESSGEDVDTALKRTKSLTIKDKETCPICFDPIVRDTSESLPMCGHRVCKDCWKELKLQNPICPVCRKVYGELRGNQPKNAKMTFKFDQRIHLPGYELFGTIVIDYVVPDGRQTEEHPNPGKPYKGTQRRAFLPNNAEGNEVLRLLEKAFKARLIFTIGHSVTTGTEDVVTWNDIHHKTNISGPKFAYPDATYLTRVKEELAAKGIK